MADARAAPGSPAHPLNAADEQSRAKLGSSPPAHAGKRCAIFEHNVSVPLGVGVCLCGLV